LLSDGGERPLWVEAVKTPRFGSVAGTTRGFGMAGLIEGEDRTERLLLPDCLDDYVGEDNLVRVVDAFMNELDLPPLGFAGPAATGRPGYSPATMLKLYLYGYQALPAEFQSGLAGDCRCRRLAAA
jgi:transposase